MITKLISQILFPFTRVMRLIKAATMFLLLELVTFYSSMISPLLGDNCRFEPTCSAYMVESIKKRGVLIGLLKGFYRILRCSPLSKGGYDPVIPDHKRDRSRKVSSD